MKKTLTIFPLVLVFAISAVAQTSTEQSVSVVASDPIATEPGPTNFPDTGAFTISRSGPTNMPLHVFFTLGGTAENGVDYQKTETTVTIAEGQRAARVPIIPLHDALVEGEERVILRLAPSPMAGPGSGYFIPTNMASAVVTIRDNDQPPTTTNVPPIVHIVRPPSGAEFKAPADIHIVADTVDRDGWVGMVEFFANGDKIGESVIVFIVAPEDGTPISHEFEWKEVRPGDYALTAKATDDEGATSTSRPVRISVRDPNEPPPRTVVSIVATDPEGSEIPEVPPEMERPQLIDPAIFTVSRTGSLSNALTVYYTVGGTAVNGVDYVEIPREVKIPEGQRSADIEINVIDDLLVEGTETVVIQIVLPVCIEIYPPPPECYLVGGTDEPKVLHFDDLSPGTEHFPVPAGYGGLRWHYFSVINGSARPASEGYHTGTVSPSNVVFNPYGEPASIRSTTGRFDLRSAYLTAALNLDTEMKIQVQGLVGSTVVYDNTYTVNRQAPTLVNFNYVGIDQARFISSPPIQFVMDNVTVAVGRPSRAEARILDNDTAPSNRPPVVSIVVPTNGAVFIAPADIQIIAHAFDSDGYVHTVEFFAGTNSLGVTTNNPFSANVMNPFQIKWEDVPPGQYFLTALATDDRGAQSRSRPVNITVIQEPVRQTVVNIHAVDPEAAEQDPRLDSLQNNALLRVTRSGPTDFDLPVFYQVGGTAMNGVDYVELKGEVVIPTGSESADIVIEAIDDKVAERTESVHVTIQPPACIAIWPPPRECYVVGSANRATAFILDDEPFDTNRPPFVEITQPSSDAIFRAPADIHIVAKTVDRDGYVGKVEFYANNHKIGEASKQFLVPPPDGEPIEYDFDWNDVRPGQYALTARGIDDQGASGFSAPVRISVVGTNEPPPTNVAVVTVYAIDGYASERPTITVTAWSGTNTNTTVIGDANTATFEVRRSGNLDRSLLVFYEMHGMASEGVDYLDLPGVAEIPAGARSARVVIVPIDDDLPERLESVIICLRPSPVMSILPGYVVGRPSQAAAVIADNDMPRVPYICLRDGVFHWCRPASNGQCFRIECSRDLKEWTELCTTRVTEGAVHYVDAEALAYDRRFYRAVPVDCPAEEP